MRCLGKPMYWMSFAVLVFGFFAAGSVIAQDINQGVYEYVVQKSPLSFEAASQALAEAIEKSDFRLVGQVDQAAPDTCSYKTRVFVLYDPEYAQSLLAANDKTGAFAVPDRINRTILMDDQKFDGPSSTHRQSLRALIQGAVSGEPSNKPYGPIRQKGYIGRTMGMPGSIKKEIKNKINQAFKQE